MKKMASGFYSSSLEMLLDTMCDMLGGIIFIALMVALVAQDSPAPAPEYYQAQAAQLSNDLAAVTASNTLVEAELQSTLQRLQNPRQHPATNLMRLPNISNTAKQPWRVIIRYGKLYPLFVLSLDGRGVPQPNTHTLLRRSRDVEPRPEMGDDPDEGVNQMAEAFKSSGKTGFYFAFWVYNDSFEAFMRARETATRLGFQFGWKPLPENARLKIDTHGERVLPQN